MQTVLTFLTAYYPYIIVVVLGLSGAVVFGKKKALSVAYAILEQYKDVLLNTVENKHDICSKFIYDNIPVYLKVFLTQKMIDVVVVDFIHMIESTNPTPVPVPEPIPAPAPAPIIIDPSGNTTISGNIVVTPVDNNQK